MSEKFVVVRADVLPEIILKVIEAKRLLAQGVCKTSTEACQTTGISRSAYYKYKDSAFAYSKEVTSNLVTYYFTLKDIAGVYSDVFSCFYKNGANVLTINQNIPIDDVTTATVTVRFENGDADYEQVRAKLAELSGVVSVTIAYGK